MKNEQAIARDAIIKVLARSLRDDADETQFLADVVRLTRLAARKHKSANERVALQRDLRMLANAASARLRKRVGKKVREASTAGVSAV